MAECSNIHQEDNKDGAPVEKKTSEKKRKKDKDKQESKKSKKKEKTLSSEEESGVGEAPVGGGTSRKEKQSKELESEEEPAKKKKKKHSNPGGDSSGAYPDKAKGKEEELQSLVDSFASHNPRSFELGTLPERRGRERLDDRSDEEVRDDRRPREPDHPPLGVFGDPDIEEVEEESTEIPRRHYPVPKKNKGGKHRERGRWYRRSGRR